jgi:pimeloyl-ACP methyl ester carboxylesterase
MTVGFVRWPAPGPHVEEFRLEVEGATLSGLRALPVTPPRAMIVAIHGLGMHAGYFDTRTAPGLSLLELAAGAGYAVWAPDRPGTGGSVDVPEHSLTLDGQADLLMRAIDVVTARHAPDAPVVLVGHSYGLKVAWTMAAQPEGRRLMGVDGASSGVTYGFTWRPGTDGAPERRPALDTWGPRALYPGGAAERSAVPASEDPAVQRAEGPSWPAEIRVLGPRISIPLRVTFGDHETIWPISEAHLAEMRSVFRGSPDIEFVLEPHAGHNVSLGWAARSYHLKVLSFVERCLLSRQLG